MRQDGIIRAALGLATQLAKGVAPAPTHIDRAAASAERKPTEAQKQAGNYRKGHIRLHGLSIAIENPAGATRSGVDPDGNAWRVTLPAHYGYIKRTEGADGDHVDVYIGEAPDSDRVWVIDQIDPDKQRFDEHKCMLGFRHREDAIMAYDKGFSDGKGPQRRGACISLSIQQFKAWLATGDTTKPLLWRSRRMAKAMQALDLAKSEEADNSLERIAAEIEESLAAKIADALDWLRPRTTKAVAANLNSPIVSGDTVAEKLPEADIEAKLRAALKPVDQAFKGGAKLTANENEKITGPRLDFTLDTGTSRIDAYLEDFKADLVRDLADGQRETVRGILAQGIAQAKPPAALARLVRDAAGLTQHQAGLVQRYRMALESGDPVALAASLRRELRDARYDTTVRNAIEAGRPLEAGQVDRMVDAYRRRFVAYRAMTIARTESVRAANAGSVASIRAALDAGELDGFDVEKTWIATGDTHTRPTHVWLDGKTVTGLDTPFVLPDGTGLRWPHDREAPGKETIQCRCTLRFRIVKKG